MIGYYWESLLSSAIIDNICRLIETFLASFIEYMLLLSDRPIGRDLDLRLTHA